MFSKNHLYDGNITFKERAEGGYKIYEGSCWVGTITVDFGIVGLSIRLEVGYSALKRIKRLMKKVVDKEYRKNLNESVDIKLN